ncbi:PqqD family protein [bacterium]|nr:PqqD family protein [bacterium]
MLRQNPLYVSRKVNEECVLVPVRQSVAEMGAVYVLNEVGARIWELVGDGQTAEQMVAILGQEFDAPTQQIAQDVASFLDRMRLLGAIVEE